MICWCYRSSVEVFCEVISYYNSMKKLPFIITTGLRTVWEILTPILPPWSPFSTNLNNTLVRNATLRFRHLHSREVHNYHGFVCILVLWMGSQFFWNNNTKWDSPVKICAVQVFNLFRPYKCSGVRYLFPI